MSNFIDPIKNIIFSDKGLDLSKEKSYFLDNIFINKNIENFYSIDNLLFLNYVYHCINSSYFIINPFTIKEKFLIPFIHKMKNLGINILIDNKSENFSKITKLFPKVIFKDVEFNFTKKIEKLDSENFKNFLIERDYKGITVIGDIHSDIESLKKSIYWAKSNFNFMIFLGDIFDNNFIKTEKIKIELIDIVYDLIIRKECFICFGNHDMKYFKYNLIKNFSLDNLLTINNIDLFNSIKLFNIMNLGSDFIKIDNFVFCHALWETNDEKDDFFDYKNKKYKRISGKYKKIDKKVEDDLSWIDNLFLMEKNFTVFIGHKILSTKCPKAISDENSNNKIYFMDTGCNKKGVLSSVDLVFDNEKNLRIRNFNVWV
ncbi:MAG: metallophosphoesterase [Candidatus Dojkabacteria bacterium]|nr:metallophosphoesterase [Candidatus Dojkabacteria bacterium]